MPFKTVLLITKIRLIKAMNFSAFSLLKKSFKLLSLEKINLMIALSHLHPMMVHFPIAIITVGFLADIVYVFYKKDACLSKMGYWLEIIGMAGAILAFGTGYFLTNPMEGEAGIVRDRHQLFATLTLISIIIGVLFRIVVNYQKMEASNLKYLSLGIFFLSFILVSITGFLGGKLVIEFMIGL